MKKRSISLLLAVLLSLTLAAPAAAANAAKVSITWLSTKGAPCEYNETLGWLTLKKEDETTCVIERKSGKRVEQYDYATDFYGDYAMVGKYIDGKIKFGCIDKNKKVVVPLEYDGMLRNTYEHVFFSDDGLVSVFQVNADGEPKYGAVDAAGKVVIPLVYDYLYRFYDGYAAVGKKTEDGTMKYGYIDKTGNVVVPMEYDRYNIGEVFSDGLAYVGNNVEINGQPGTKWGWVDKTGKVVIPLENMATSRFYDDRFVMQRFGEKAWFYSVYDKSGKVIVPEGQYDEIDHFSEGLARVKKKDSNGNSKCGYIDTNGKVVIPLEYDSTSLWFEDGIAAVGKKSADGTWNWKYIDRTGKTVLTLNDNYTSVSNTFDDGLASVSKGLVSGYIDKTGKVVVPVKYNGGSVGFYNGFATVILNGKEGAVNTSGTFVVPVEYDDVFLPGSDSRDVFEVEKVTADGTAKRGCYNQNGKLVIPLEYDGIGQFIDQPEGRPYLLIPRKNDKYGIFDSNGTVILPVEYDEIGAYGNLIYVKKDGAYGVFERP